MLNADGSDATSGIGVLNPFRYRGYYYDTETELYYLQTRYYDPEVGRFISQDSVEYADPETINGFNLYAYCANNPVMNVDPTGTIAISVLIGLIIGATVGAVAGGYIAGKAAYDNGARGWELFGWTLLGVVGGGIAGGAIGAAVGWAAPAIGSFFGSSFTLAEFALASGQVVTVSITGGQAVAGVLGLLILFATSKRSGKDMSSDKPSWAKPDMVDHTKSPQQNATDMLNNKYGQGNWKQGSGTEFSKIVKWIARKIFFKG